MTPNLFTLIPTNSEQPSWTILSGGVEIPRTNMPVQIMVSHFVNRIAAARIIFHDGEVAARDFPLSNEDYFAPGKKIKIKAGYDGREETIFEGLVIRHQVKMGRNRNSMLVVECKDAALKMTVARKSAFFNDQKDSDIMDALISNHSGVRGDVQSTRVTHKEMVQYHVTDWDFLISRAELNGMLVFNHAGKVEVKKPDFRAQPLLEVGYGTGLLDFEAGLDASEQFSAAKMHAWDYTGQEMLELEGEEPRFGTQSVNEKNDLTDVLSVNDSSGIHSGHIPDSEMQAWADARLMRTRLASLRGRACFQGYNKVFPGDMIEITGVGDRFTGKVFVAGVKHSLSRGKWETEVEIGLDSEFFLEQMPNVADRPAAALVPPIHGLQTGKIVQLESDPDAQYRVLVKVPVISDTDDGVWARVALLDAGNERGTYFLPEVGDEVILGFVNDDPRDAIVLGCLHSQNFPAPLEHTDDNHEKGIITRSKMKLLFNDDVKSILLETPAGNTFLITEEDEMIQIVDSNKNEFTLSKDGITLKSAKDVIIDAKGDLKVKATNITQEAKSSCKIESNGTLDLKGSAQANLKGGIVNIN